MSLKYLIFGILFLLSINLVSAAVTTTGNVTTFGVYSVITFLSNGTFNTTENISNVEILVVAGGGGASTGGGGAGGYIYNASYTINAGNYNVTVGTKGLGISNRASGDGYGQNGQNSSFSTLIAIGGGAGGGAVAGWPNGRNGGSGGGAGGSGNPTIGGNGTSGQGSNGGGTRGFTTPNYPGGGGGGCGGAGGNATSGSVAGAGGNGCSNNITGTPTYYSAGGGSGVDTGGTAGSAGLGGVSGSSTGAGANATTYGSGGGGGGGAGTTAGGNGGAGIVIIRYVTAYYSIRGNVSYNTTRIENSTVALINPTTNVVYGTVLTNSSGNYIFTSTTYPLITNSSLWIISTYFKNATTYLTKSIWVNVTVSD